MILLKLNYSGFMLISCNLGDHTDLQILQNDAIRTCCGHNIAYKISIDDLHNEMCLLSLEQRL